MQSNLIYHQYGIDSLYKIWHTIDDRMMILYTYSNDGGIVCSDKIYPIRKGVLCFVGAKKYHYTMPDNPDTYDRTKLTVCTDEFLKILSYFSEENHFYELFTPNSVVYAQIPTEIQPEVEKIFDELNDYSDNEIYYPLIYMAAVLKLLIYMHKYALERIPQSSGFVTNAIEYINNHISENISIERICNDIHISKYYFCRRFKKITGTTVMEYILKTRLAAAKNMLKEDDLSISDIAEKCGFCSISYFCRVFKENVGITALAYRKKNKNS